MSLGLDIHKISKSCWFIRQRKANKRNLTKLDKFNQNQFINYTKYVFYSIKWCKDLSPPHLWGVRYQQESRYRHLWPSLVSETKIFSVLVSSLRLRFFSLGLIIEAHTFAVSVSWLRLTSFQSPYRSRHWDLDFSVLVSLLRLGHFQSRSCHWDSELFSLGLVIETQTFSVSVSMIQIWSRWSLLRTQNHVSVVYGNQYPGELALLSV